MKEVCTEQMDSLDAAVQLETRSFQQRLADSEGDGPSVPETMRVLSNALTESVRQHTAQLEGRLETMLDHVSVCLQEELSREQERASDRPPFIQFICRRGCGTDVFTLPPPQT